MKLYWTYFEIPEFQKKMLELVKNNPAQFYIPRNLGQTALRGNRMKMDLALVVGHDANVQFLLNFWERDHEKLGRDMRVSLRHRFDKRQDKYGPLNLAEVVNEENATDLRNRANRNLAEGQWLDAINLTLLAYFVKEFV